MDERRFCGLCSRALIPGELFVAHGWEARKDNLNFLSPIPKEVWCVGCGNSEEIKKYLSKKEKRHE